MADEQVKKMITDFTAMRDKCYKQTEAGTYLEEEVFCIFTSCSTTEADIANVSEHI